MTAVIEVPITWDHPPCACEVDELASGFLRQESETAAAYATAIKLDEQLEVMRERLILCVEQFGAANGEHKLAGARFTIVMRHPTVTVLEPAMVQWFHLALLKTPRSDLFLKIFTPHLSWSWAPGASEAIPMLPEKVRRLFEKCQITRVDPPVIEIRSH